jgi:hypothetical protein
MAEVTLRYAPDDARREIDSWLRKGWKAKAQGGGDLGVRLQAAFADAFAEGNGPVLILGSDCPWVTPKDLTDAIHALNAGEADAVFGPATDGGYWLVGLNRLLPGLFDDIPWSTERVLAVSQMRATQQGMRIRLLRTLSDVDTSEDWEAYLRWRETPGALKEP